MSSSSSLRRPQSMKRLTPARATSDAVRDYPPRPDAPRGRPVYRLFKTSAGCCPSIQVALWACGEKRPPSLSLLSLNAPQTLFIVMPVPSTALPEPVLNALFQGSSSAGTYCFHAPSCCRKCRPPRRPLAECPPLQLPRHPPCPPHTKTPPPKRLTPYVQTSLPSSSCEISFSNQRK